MNEVEDGSESGLGSYWAELTQVCLVNILSRLTFEERWRGPMLVCKPWLNACKDPSLNSVIDLESHFGSATELPRYWTPEFERRIDSMLRSVALWSDGSLKEIRVRHCSDRSLSLVAERCVMNLFIHMLISLYTNFRFLLQYTMCMRVTLSIMVL